MSADTFRRLVKTIAVLCVLVCGSLGIASVGFSASSTTLKPQAGASASYGAKASTAARHVFLAKSDELEIPMDDATPTPTFAALKAVTLSTGDPTPAKNAADALIDTDIPMASVATPTPAVQNNNVVPQTEEPKETVPTPPEEKKEEATATPEVTTETSGDTATPTWTDTATATWTDTAAVMPTSVVEDVKTPTTPEERAVVDKTRNVLPGKRTGLTPEWFNYLIEAGYLVRSTSNIPKFGIIAENSQSDEQMTVGKHLIIRQTSKENVKIGDQLVVYRVMDAFTDPETNQSLGLFVKNLGILKVTRIDAKYIQVDVQNVYSQFKINDSVKSFEDELDRWKQSRRRKPLSADPIECFVSGLPNGMERALMNDPLVLNAGEDQGVVAGMDFELQKPVEVAVGKTVWVKTGKARVFFVGGKYSMAKVIWNRDLILNGFRAQYQP